MVRVSVDLGQVGFGSVATFLWHILRFLGPNWHVCVHFHESSYLVPGPGDGAKSEIEKPASVTIKV